MNETKNISPLIAAALPKREPESAPSGLDVNRGAHLSINTKPHRANKRMRSLTGEQYREVLERRADLARESGFGRLLLFEPGSRDFRDRFDRSRAVRPLNQASTLAAGHCAAIEAFIRDENELDDGVEVDVYVSTFNRWGCDEPPGATEAWIDETLAWSMTGVRVLYIDASGYNAGDHNITRVGDEKRPDHFGGGRRLDGLAMLNRAIDSLEVSIVCGGEPFPGINEDQSLAPYACSLLQNIAKRVRRGEESLVGAIRIAVASGHERHVFVRSIEEFEEFAHAAHVAAQAGALFSVWHADEQLVAAATEHNAISHAARAKLREAAKEGVTA